MDKYDKRCVENEVQEKGNNLEIVVFILVLSIFIINLS
jgi:hypothetical protein